MQVLAHRVCIAVTSSAWNATSASFATTASAAGTLSPNSTARDFTVSGSFTVSGTSQPTTIFNQFGGEVNRPTFITGAYTASLGDYIIAVSASGLTNVTFPTACEVGRKYIVKDISGSISCSVWAQNGEKFDGVASGALGTARAVKAFVYFGALKGWGEI